jgi:hypothetical protein
MLTPQTDKGSPIQLFTLVAHLVFFFPITKFEQDATDFSLGFLLVAIYNRFYVLFVTLILE